jgi:hypothetical protein
MVKAKTTLELTGKGGALLICKIYFKETVIRELSCTNKQYDGRLSVEARNWIGDLFFEFAGASRLQVYVSYATACC